MKKYMAFALTFLLIAALFTACGRSNVSNDPHGMIKDSIATSESTSPVNPVPTMTIPSETSTNPSETSVSPSSSEESTAPTLTESVNPSDSEQKRS